MEELINNPLGEQPGTTHLGAAAHEVNENGSVESGSPYGKFNNANDLLNAYNNLQSEFTRKCQRLSELEKQEVSDNVSVEDAPQYTKADWQEQISEFLKSHPNAQNYAKDIAQMLYSDKTLACNPSSLELAYGRILAREYKSNEELVKDDEFLNKYIYSNSDITSKILDKYLNDVAKAPHLISSKVGASVGLTPTTKPTNLNEARKMAELLFRR